MKKICNIYICIAIIFSLFSGTISVSKVYGEGDNILEVDGTSTKNSSDGSIGILSTTVYPDARVVKFGEKIHLNYYFTDKAHPVIINIYKDGTLLADAFYRESSWGQKISYEPQDEGEYRFVVKPTDAVGYTEDCRVIVYKDRIIFIPGTMGSELLHDGNRVWEPRESASFALDMNNLMMNSSGQSIKNITVGKSIGSYYGGMISFFKNEGYQVVDFAYDWRLGASRNAEELKKRIVDEIASSESSLYSNYYIVAHSMGGIIATEFIKQGNGSMIKKMITLGTPFYGAPQAAYMFETGKLRDDIPFYFEPIVGLVVRELERNVPSIYELLPTKSYFSYQTNGYIEVRTSSNTYGSNVKTTKYNTFSDTVNFLKNSRDWTNNVLLDKAINLHAQLDPINRLKQVDSYYFVGDQKPTAGKIVFNSPVKNNALLGDVKNIQGDGVVPVSSATAGFGLDSSRTYYINRSHIALPSSTDVQKQILNILKNKPNDLVSEKIRRKTSETKTLKFKAECPVELHMYDSSGNHTGPTGSSFDSNISDAKYFTDGETKIALVNDVEDYKVRIVGTGYGQLTFSIIWADESDVENRTIRFDNVVVTPNSIFKADVNQNGQVILQVDQNGDGNFERSISPSVDLDLGGTQDETIPTISSHIDGVKGVNEWYGINVYYNLTGADNESGVYKIFYNLNDTEEKEYNEAVALPKTGVYTFKSFVRDKNRNDSEVLTETVKVDTTNPTPPVMLVNPNVWTNKSVTISLSGGTDADSGFQKYQYKINRDGEWKDYISPVVIDTEGVYDIFARSVDNVYNLSEEVAGVAKIDRTPPHQPIMTVEPIKWTNQFVTVTLSEGIDTDKGFPNSGFQKYQYKIGQDGEWKDYTAPIIIDTEGLYNVFARAVDNVNLISDEVSGQAKVDKTKPTTPGSFITHTRNYDSIKISWAPATDNVGVVGYDIYLDSKLIDSTTSTSYKFTNLSEGNTYQFKVMAKDEAGNYSEEAIYFDKTPLSLISISSNHTLRVKEDGTVWSWGNNNNGQLGDGTTTAKTTAIQVADLTNVVSVAAGSAHSLALKSDGTVWAWGYKGLLGIGNQGSLVPVPVPDLTNIIAIAAYGGSSYALKSDGTVWSWGDNFSGQLGDNTTTNRTTPVQVIGLTGVSRLAAGDRFVYALKSDGTVWGWGYAQNKQLGVSGSRYKAEAITGLTGVTQVAAGSSHGLALKKDGSVWIWGQITNTITNPTPTAVSGLSNIKAIAAGNLYSFAISKSGSVWAWGTNVNGELGDGTRTTPTGLINIPTLSGTSAIAVGYRHSAASKIDGSVWTWGISNSEGQLGDGTVASRLAPVLVKEDVAPKVTLEYPIGTQSTPSETNVSNPSIRWNQEDAALTVFTAYQVQLLDEAGAVVIDSGVVSQPVTTSDNAWTVSTALRPNQVLQVRVKVRDEHTWSEWSQSGWLTSRSAVQEEQQKVSTSSNHTLRVKEDGTVWSWGNNNNGQLGDGTTTAKTTAIQVADLTNVVSVAAGSSHSLALKSDGTVWAWGYKGLLGIGNQGSLVPVPVPDLTNIIAIAAYGGSSYALKSDGTVWSWGDNFSGQLGDNTTTNRTTPVQVIGLTGVSHLAAGNSFVYALKSDGTVWGWGFAQNKQLGVSGNRYKAEAITGLTGVTQVAAGNSHGLALKKDGSVWVWGQITNTTTNPTPTAVSGLSNIKAIAAGNLYSFAISKSGSVWAWGTNVNGELGDGTRTTPTGLINIPTLSGTSAIAVGYRHSAASKIDSSVWTWGISNSEGQLGDGTVASRLAPVLVKEDVAPKVTLEYPIGTQSTPSETNVSNPSIRWNQEDAALTVFTAYQVRVMNSEGVIVTDSGEVLQNSTVNKGTWAVNTLLSKSESFKVQVRVKDEHTWSEWSPSNWFKISDTALNLKNINLKEKLFVEAGEQTTVRVSVYDTVYANNPELLNGILKVKISNYKVSSSGNSGQFGQQELSSTGTTLVDVQFSNGVAEIPLILTVVGEHQIYYEVIDVIDSLKEIEVIVFPSGMSITDRSVLFKTSQKRFGFQFLSMPINLS